MASIKVKLRSSEPKQQKGKIYFQITHNHIVRRWNTEYMIFFNEWDNKKSIILISPNSERQKYLEYIRERIKCDKERLRRIIIEFSDKNIYSIDEILEEFKLRQEQQSFFLFMKNVISQLKEFGKQRTSQTYTSALNSFHNFKNGENVMFDEFNSDLMESYQAHLKAKGLIPNSTSFHMRILRAVYNRAVEKGITEDKKPFRHVYTGVDKTTKRAIDINTIKKIKELDLSQLPQIDYARDIFLLSFYFRGMSFVDMAYLKKFDLNHGHITYRRRKTGQTLTVKWTNEMQCILDKYPQNKTEYLLPIVTSKSYSPYNQYRAKQFQINKWLKKVAKLIGLDMSLTLYCSRHSWASIAKLKGIPTGIIRESLGHDNERTTQIYLSTLDTSAVDNANAMIIKLL